MSVLGGVGETSILTKVERPYTIIPFSSSLLVHRILFLPFTMDWVVVGFGLEKHVLALGDRTPKDIFILVSNLIYGCSIPGRIIWDSGCVA